MSGRILSILIVATNFIICKSKLKKNGFELEYSGNINDAIKLLTICKYDLIITDNRIEPQEIEVMRHILGASKTQLMVVSGDLTPHNRHAFLQAGADEVLTQNFTNPLFPAHVRNLVRRAKTERDRHVSDHARKLFSTGQTVVSNEKLPLTELSADMKDPLFRLICNQKQARFTFTNEDKQSPQDLRDLVIIDGRAYDTHDTGQNLVRHISGLKERDATRNAAIMVILPPGGEDVGATLADLGADLGIEEIVLADATLNEITLRAARAIERKQHRDRLQRTLQNGLKAAVTDPLTGLHNRRYALPCLNEMLDSLQTEPGSLAVIAVDIDYFKAVNDTYGHDVGDKVLVNLAELLRKNLRTQDLIARMGGEEFLIALPDTTEVEALITAERLRDMMAGNTFEIGQGVTLNLTLSIGFCIVETGDIPDIESVIKQADVALYKSKSAGRNKVTLFQAA